ncbi:hypothetical protein V6Z12_A04G073400 [Gossypium hirsutum]
MTMPVELHQSPVIFFVGKWMALRDGFVVVLYSLVNAQFFCRFLFAALDHPGLIFLSACNNYRYVMLEL